MDLYNSLDFNLYIDLDSLADSHLTNAFSRHRRAGRMKIDKFIRSGTLGAADAQGVMPLKGEQVEYKMSPEEYFRKIIELYNQSRDPKYYNPNIKRGRSSSISSELEDLTALFIALNNPNQCSYFTDQPIKFEGSTTKYPDIVIQNKDGKIENLIDVKTDIGWNRDGMYSFCEEWEKKIQSAKGTETSFKQGTDKSINHGVFSKKLKYHVLVISKINSGRKIESDYEKVKKDLENVCLYVLSDGVHPNNYEYTFLETMKKIAIHGGEFERLFSYINKA